MTPIPYFVPVYGGPADGDEVPATLDDHEKILEGQSYTLLLVLRPSKPGTMIQQYEYHPTPARTQ